MSVKIDEIKCIGCGACVEACPMNALKLDGDKVTVDAEVCIDCGACVGNCPVEALSL